VYSDINISIPSSSVINAIPTAELRPLEEGQVTQTDENEIGLTYEELSVMGRLRRPGSCGPYSMFIELTTTWHPKYTYDEVSGLKLSSAPIDVRGIASE